MKIDRKFPREDSIERLALQMYDELNPDYQREVRISKAECIRRAREKYEGRSIPQRRRSA